MLRRAAFRLATTSSVSSARGAYTRAGPLAYRAFASQSGSQHHQQQQQPAFWAAATAAAAALAAATSLIPCGPALLDEVSFCDKAHNVPNATDPAPSIPAPKSQQAPKRPMSRRKLARRNSMRKQKRNYQYVIVGAGTTTYAAIEAIRAVDTDADILIISDQSKLPHIDIDSSEEDQLLECDALANTYNEWRRHVNSRLENEPDAYSTSAVSYTFQSFSHDFMDLSLFSLPSSILSLLSQISVKLTKARFSLFLFLPSLILFLPTNNIIAYPPPWQVSLPHRCRGSVHHHERRHSCYLRSLPPC